MKPTYCEKGTSYVWVCDNDVPQKKLYHVPKSSKYWGEKTIPEQKKSSTVSENKNVTCLLDTQVFIPETLGHKFPQVELLIVPRTTVFVIVIEKLRGSTCYCRALNAHGFCGGKP